MSDRTPAPAELAAVRRYEAAHNLPVTCRLDASHWTAAAQFWRDRAAQYQNIGSSDDDGHTPYALGWAADRAAAAQAHATRCELYATAIDLNLDYPNTWETP